MSAPAPIYVQRTTAVAQWPFRADVGPTRYVLRATLVAAIGSAFLLGPVFAAVRLLGLDFGTPPPVPSTVLEILGAVVLAPLLESLVLAGALHVLSRWLRAWPVVAAIAALGAGLAHGAVSPLWFFAPAWSFFVYAAAFLAWRPQSWRSAYAAAAMPHALLNAMAVGAGNLL